MNINLTLNKIKSDLISEANLNVNLRRMVYDYFSADPDKKDNLRNEEIFLKLKVLLMPKKHL